MKKFIVIVAYFIISASFCRAEYFVQSGVFLEKKDAIDQQVYLLSRNYPATLYLYNNYYKVVLGGFEEKYVAESVVQRLLAEDNIVSGLVNDPYEEDMPAVQNDIDMTDEMIVRLIDTAFEFLGVSYKYGGMDPKKGIDCSYFVQTIYKSFGITLPRTSILQFRVGKKVKKEELIPGDLVFFRKYPKGSRINHVGIYIGNDKFIHAALGAGKVTVSSLNELYFKKRYSGARRQL
ncbi:MAG: Murein DD-endopeptidase MepS/Murein LD-carboxypeptidase precursor [Elusimicrobia bacterium ADurb.Bin231]|nr:MAG: Murein DD-endopeptidase MepS/Murein LD-carboxypeptidase precursor [Elusimicrobia bacterium ADurb.Bin231]